jgi:hypothetical protein
MPRQINTFNDLSRRPFRNIYRKAAIESAPSDRNLISSFTHKFKTWSSWMGMFAKFLFTRKHPFVDPLGLANRSCYAIDDITSITLAGDWANGTYESDAVGQSMLKWKLSPSESPDYTIHIGDIYYVGGSNEIGENCFGENVSRRSVSHLYPGAGVVWPKGKKGSFALMGNHEMMAKGHGYYKAFLPRLGIKRSDGSFSGQQTSCFCLENTYWRIIAVDTGYHHNKKCILDDLNVQWLRAILSGAPAKATIILSHHQYFSAFEGEDNYPKPAAQLYEFIKSPALWFWGHEHRLAGYELGGTGDLKAFGRCIGHGAMPTKLGMPEENAKCPPLKFFDNRGHPVYVSQFGINGYCELDLQNEKLHITYYETIWYENKPAEARPIVYETFESQGGTVVHISTNKAPNIDDDSLFVDEGPLA